MISEEEFQAALDADPTDSVTRLVFADWLEEQGDPRAAGYRALGQLGHCPLHYYDCDFREWTWWKPDPTYLGRPDALGDVGAASLGWWEGVKGFLPHHSSADKSFRTRREADDAAALAFQCGA